MYTSIRGNVTIKSIDQETTIAVQKGMSVNPGTIIKTSPDSYIDISSSEGQFRIQENSKVIFTENFSKTVDSNEEITKLPQIDLISGQIFLKMEKLHPNLEFKVKGPTGVAAIRGTAFFVEASGQNTQISVLESEVELQSIYDPNQSVVAGPLMSSSVSPMGKYNTESIRYRYSI